MQRRSISETDFSFRMATHKSTRAQRVRKQPEPVNVDEIVSGLAESRIETYTALAA